MTRTRDNKYIAIPHDYFTLLKLNANTKTTIFNHSHSSTQASHIRFDDARVIDQATDSIPRRVKEVLHIRKREGATMNKDAGLTLSRQWEACVEKSVNG